jgi:HSP20 family molecular chaperone IbpA
MSRGLIPNRDDFFFPFEQQFHKFFDEFFNKESLSNVGKNSGFPKLNVHEIDDEMVMTVSVSGMTADDLKVEVSPENVLTIRGRVSKQHQLPEKSKVYILELRSSAFERRLQLPENIEGDPVASLKDGMLTLKWKVKSKDPPKPRNKLISIRSD